MQNVSNPSVNEKILTPNTETTHNDNIPVEEPQPRNVMGMDKDITYPEGGTRAWLIVLATSLNGMSTFGYAASWGVFQAYYETGPLAGISPSKIAWIGSVQFSLMFLPGLITGRLFDRGYLHHILIVAAAISIVANFTIAECTQYWQFLLAQGIAFGISSGLAFIPGISTISHWFKVKRPFILAILALGSSLGGVIFPLMFRSLVPRVGFKWAIRAIAFINTFSFVFVNIVIKTRLPPNKEKRLLAVSDFVSIPYVVYVLSTLFAFLGLYTPFFFVSLSAQAIGISTSLSFALLAVLNGLSGIGRIVIGGLSLKYGPVNMMIVFTALATAMLFTWPFVTSHGGFIAVICIYGFSSGAFIGLFPAPVASLGSVHSVGERTGLQMTIMALGALGGPPISGAILSRDLSFHQVGAFAGVMLVVSVVLLILTRWTAWKFLGAKKL